MILPETISKEPLGPVVRQNDSQWMDIVKWTVYMVHGQSPAVAFQRAGQVLGRLDPPPAISVVQVAGLAHPDFLVEIEAIAVVPEP